MSAATAVVSGQSMFTAGVVTGVAHVAMAVACLVTVEVVEALFTAPGERSCVAVTWVKAVVDVAVEAGMSVEPGTCADEDAAQKPVRSVVTVGRAIVRCVVEIAVRANRGNADVDGHLGGIAGRAAGK
jgi:hypothetical protein